MGDNAIDVLQNKHVMVVGLGGVGSFAAEALVRGGVGAITLVDNESYDLSNCNRQLFATTRTVGVKKTIAAKERLLCINPECKIQTFDLFYAQNAIPEHFFDTIDYVIDAIDTVRSKMDLIEETKRRNIPLISCLGTGNKLDPTAFRVSDIKNTKICPLARVIRSECRKRGIDSLKVVYSEEEPKGAVLEQNGRFAPASVSFVPGAAGLILAGEVIKDLIKE